MAAVQERITKPVPMPQGETSALADCDLVGSDLKGAERDAEEGDANRHCHRHGKSQQKVGKALEDDTHECSSYCQTKTLGDRTATRNAAAMAAEKNGSSRMSLGRIVASAVPLTIRYLTSSSAAGIALDQTKPVSMIAPVAAGTRFRCLNPTGAWRVFVANAEFAYERPRQSHQGNGPARLGHSG